MPRKNAREIEQDEVEEVGVGGGERDAIAEFFAKIDSIDGAATVRVARVNPRTGRPATLHEYPAGDFDPMQLAHDFGGGSYRLQLIDGRSKQILSSTTHEIDAAVKPSRLSASPSAEPASIETMMLKLQLDFKDQMLQMMREQQKPAGGLDGEKFMALMMQMQANTVAMMKDNGSKGGIIEAIEAMKAMQDMLPGGGGEDDWAGAIKSLMHALPALSQSANAGENRNATVNAGENRNTTKSPAVNPNRSLPATPASPAPADQLQRRQENALRAVVAIIIAGSKRGADPEDYPNVVIDTLENAEIDITEVLSAPNELLLQQLAGHAPSLKGHEPFAGAVLDAVRLAIVNEETEDEQPASDAT